MAKSESTKIEFGYFHDYESEQFAFYRIPKVLFTDEYFRNLSSDAKVLYGLMLDRMALSIRHQWFDEEGKVYIIFTVEQVIQYMNCGRDEETKELCETLEKEMISLMSPDLQAMFEDYKEYTLNLKQTEQRDAYIDGLAFGIRTISEAFLHENKNRIW